jgi:LSU ribosomal protein L6P
MGPLRRAVRVPYAREELEIPQGVSATVEKIGLFDYRVVVKGPLGSVERVYRNVPISISMSEGKIVLEVFGARKREYAILGAIKGELKNAFTGVSRGLAV